MLVLCWRHDAASIDFLAGEGLEIAFYLYHSSFSPVLCLHQVRLLSTWTNIPFFMLSLSLIYILCLKDTQNQTLTGQWFRTLIHTHALDWTFKIKNIIPLLHIYHRYLPESPRWLLAQKRTKEALDILENLAKVNGTELPEKLKERLSLQVSQQIIYLFHTKK